MSIKQMASLAARSMLLLLPMLAAASEINACKYLIVVDFSSDPYGIAKELRTQGRTRGFSVISSANEAAANDQLKVCVMSGSWSASSFGGNLSLRVVDSSGLLLGEAAGSGTAWISARRTVRGVVSKIYTQLGYSGFNEDVYQRRIAREYPKRPTLAVTEEQIRTNVPHSRIEGIWTDTEDRYRLGIVPAPAGSGADYVAVVLHSGSPLWQAGEIKAEIRGTASSEVFTCTYFLQNKKPAGMTLTIEKDESLRGSGGSAVSTSAGAVNLTLVRVWPPHAEGAARETPAPGAFAVGTGFVLNRAGLIATNWHVIADAKSITVALPAWDAPLPAHVLISDRVNDLAILRLLDSSKTTETCSETAFALASASGVSLGDKVSTIGYPLTSMLGSSPKFFEGVVSSKNGIQDDPRWMQISAQVQPGSSGSPLFNSEGRVIGIVVATLDAKRVFQAASALPQNVNFAIKADYLINLLDMAPAQSFTRREAESSTARTAESPTPRPIAFSVERAAQCVAIIRSAL